MYAERHDGWIWTQIRVCGVYDMAAAQVVGRNESKCHDACSCFMSMLLMQWQMMIHVALKSHTPTSVFHHVFRQTYTCFLICCCIALRCSCH